VIVLLAVLIYFSFLCFPLPVISVDNISNDDVLKQYIESAEKATNNKEKALIYKQLAELLIARDDFKNAATFYVKALSLSQDFSEQEKIQIANYMAWGERLSDAITLLRDVLQKNPDNQEARVNLAKFLSWSGQLDEAIKEADNVLYKSPQNREALLVKANAINWKGKPRQAIPIYESLLKEQEDFDARLSYTYALLGIGSIKAAKESAMLLKSSYEYQEKELKELQDKLDTVRRPTLDSGYSYYRDSDHNILNRYYANFEFWFNDYKFDLHYRHTAAKGWLYNNRAEEVSLGVYKKVSDTIGIGVGTGLADLHNSTTHNFITGHINADIDFLEGSVGVMFSREVMTDTAEIIDNKIKINNLGLNIVQRLTDRWSIYGSYNYKDYSDNNFSHDFQITPKYLILNGNPGVSIGYTLRYLTFDRQTYHGYFDPENFLSNQLTLYFNYVKDKFYIYLEPYGGYQGYKRYGDSKHEVFGGGSGILGYKISKSFSMEFNGEGGNYAGGAGATAGWKYYILGFRIKSVF